MPLRGLMKIPAQRELKKRRQPKYFLCLNLDVFINCIVCKDTPCDNLSEAVAYFSTYGSRNDEFF